ncbi:THUMP-like domain-containing protein [Pareuzebyella sediminis]|uniref:THUMP-like domain-containing protein n=1 Tax=Pareuzebyella sediminis TaxID=2607998 RepID=UPI0011EBDBE7|nr:class I SAM-dependent methyltransferase [Pareuzebyella sediminis]
MNKHILHTGVQSFIRNNFNTDTLSVILKPPFFDLVSNKELAQQLESRKKCEKKLPTWFSTPKIYYPSKLNIEQTSSEITAKYKTEIVSGNSLLDVTGGYGVDTFFFSKKIAKVFHCEMDKNLSDIASYNFKILGADNITAISGNGMDVLSNSGTIFDWVYIDPARRDSTKKKVFLLTDSEPNVLEHLDLLFLKSNNVLIKTAPLLDIALGIDQLTGIKEIHVVAVHNEVKELLWILEKGYEGEIRIKTVNLKKKGRTTFDYALEEEDRAISQFSEPLDYLYSPNPAILKAGAFKLVGSRLGLKKLHRHTHLYTTSKLSKFPGRRFLIKKVIPYSKKTVKAQQIKYANIATRNFPETVATLKKKFNIRDGGEDYLFFATDQNEQKVLIICTKVPPD